MKYILRPYEPLPAALRRFKRLMQRAGISREINKHAHYIKPSEKRRLKELRLKSNHENGNNDDNGVDRRNNREA